MKSLVLILTALLFAGCATNSTPQIENIAVLYEKPQNCKLLGREIGHRANSWGAMSLLGLKNMPQKN